MNQALNAFLMDAAAKSLGKNLTDFAPAKGGLRKADPRGLYADYDLSLTEFFVPGRTRPGDPSREQRMIASLQVQVEKLQKENATLRRLVVSERDKAREAGLVEGRAKGLSEGYDKGKGDMRTSLSMTQQNLAGVLKAFEARKDGILRNTERKTLEIILTAVETVVRREAATRPDTILQILRKTITEVSRTDTVTVRVNPAEVAAVDENREFWTPVNSRLKDVQIEADPRVEKGGCVLETKSGSVDARLDVQLSKVRETFLKCWEEGLAGESQKKEENPK